MKKWICLPLAALLLIALFCATQFKTVSAAKHTFQVYFRSNSMTSSSALEPETRTLNPKEDSIPQLLQWLLDGPQETDHSDVLPEGVTLISQTLHDSVLTLNFSKEYSELTGVDLTVANGSIVLTMTQLKGVDGVTILSAGEQVLPSTTLPLTANDFDLSGKSADPVELTLPLYFLSQNGTDAISENRTIQASATSVSASAQAALDALCAGPVTKGLRSFLPATTDGVSVQIKNGTCSLTVTDAWCSILLDADGAPTLSAWALTATLTGIDGIDQVSFLDEQGAELPGLSEKRIAAIYHPS